MEKRTFKVTLANGTALEGLTLNGNNYISAKKITEDIFRDNLSKVTIEGPDGVQELENMELVQIQKYDKEYWFVLRQLSDQELKDRQTQENVKKADKRMAALEAMLTPETGEKVNAFIDAIVTPEKPDLPDKPGFKWALKYAWGDSGFTWEMVEDPDAQGTGDNPIQWTPGMTVRANYWYSHEGQLYVCVQSGTPAEITDLNYFEPMN